MTSDTEIADAFARAAVSDVLDWARERCTKPPHELSAELGIDASPADLRQYFAAAAREAGCYDEFVRVEAVRCLNFRPPPGFGGVQDPVFDADFSWLLWSSVHEPGNERAAREVWESLLQTRDANPQWSPEDPDDPLLAAAFGDEVFAISDEYGVLQDALALMWATVDAGAPGWTEAQGVANLAALPAGYGLLYGLWTFVGDVMNGGLHQFYGNGGAARVDLAIRGLGEIGRSDLAEVLRDSKGIGSRQLDSLDSRFFDLCASESDDWLEQSVIALMTRRSDLFRQDAP